MSRKARKTRDGPPGVSGLKSRDRSARTPVSGLKSRDTKSEGPDAPSLLDRLWVRLLVAGWVIAIVLIYYRLQIMRVLEVLSR